ncbi:MAG: peptidoglycan DD-metalloendopeptidase family protein [Trichormus sp. ATA11-4-KO1]|nr:peptidoglycan DD-metalloendopeptidase family protein [Trichormus sp. ATA11-4-KO1]
MKRALKKREKAVLKNTPSSDDAPVEQLNINVVNPRVNRRVRTKAAMIGLAISMGATSLLVTRQSDQAQAAAPVGSQKAASTIPAVSDTEVKFASTKLETQIVSSASVPENPVIVEPTAISQLPGLEARWQVAASGMSVQVPTSDTLSKIAVSQTSSYQQSPVLQGLATGNHPGETVQKVSSDDSVTDGHTALLTPQPQQSTVASGEINAQLKAQQEFALNRLQEKSHRLRKSLAELRSEETKISQTNIELAQPQNTETALQISASKTAVEESSTPTNDITESLASRLQQTQQTSEPQPQAVTIPVPATPQVVASSATKAYEVKPGDTLAAIASRYNTSIAELVKANNLSNPDQLKISQRLIIPIAQVNRSRAIQIPVVVNPTSVQSSSAPQLTNYSVNSASINPNPPVASSQLPVFANNSSVTIPTPVTANSQIQVNTEISTETESTSVNTNGLGGDTPVPKVFAEIQRSRKAAEQTASTKDNERLRGLQAEIQRLQEKYRTQQSGNASVPAVTENETPAVPIPVAKPNNFAVSRTTSGQQNVAIPIPVPSPMLPGYNSQPVNPQFRTTRSNGPVNPEFLPNQKPGESGTRVATPPRGVDASDSLGKLRGTKVSPQLRPQLPPLAAVDQYLPKPIDATTPPPSSASTAYVWPAKGVLTSGYGRRWGRMHRGIDIANATGTPIYAAADGVVETSGWNRGGYGILVEIRHPDGSKTRYAHNNRTLVQAGQQVSQGQQIAEMGSTGFSTGPHTHFEIHPAGKGASNPIAFLPQERL